MGQTITQLFQNMFFKSKESRIIMIGLDAAGKTTILYKLKLGEVLSQVPTIGFNVEKVKYKKITFTVWDIGGQDKIRLLWKHYYESTDAIIFVVDSSDTERFEIAKEEIVKTLSDESLRDAPLLVFANKQDCSSVSVSEISEKLDLPMLRNRKWFIQGTCALNGDGLYNGLEWLSDTLMEKK